jgi:MFS superfamily sulfate permease-like transporter
MEAGSTRSGIPRTRRLNLAAGLGRGLPVSGGMSQSLVNERAARARPFGFAAALVILAVVLFSHP